MIRLLIAGLMVLMAGNANADVDNKYLNQKCRSYVDAGYKLEDVDGVLCMAYFRGIADLLNDLCIVGKSPDIDLPEDTKSFLRYLGANPKDLTAPIQEYVNQMQANPKKWDQIPSFHVGEAVREIYPCD